MLHIQISYWVLLILNTLYLITISSLISVKLQIYISFSSRCSILFERFGTIPFETSFSKNLNFWGWNILINFVNFFPVSNKFIFGVQLRLEKIWYNFVFLKNLIAMVKPTVFLEFLKFPWLYAVLLKVPSQDEISLSLSLSLSQRFIKLLCEPLLPHYIFFTKVVPFCSLFFNGTVFVPLN